MRVVSKFHDYYDLGMQYGTDDDIVWVRATEEVKGSPKILGINKSWFYHYAPCTKSYYCSVIVNYLAFCGKLYPIHCAAISKGKYYNSKADIIARLHTSTLDEMFTAVEKLTKESTVNYEDRDPFSNRYSWNRDSGHEYEMGTWVAAPCHKLHIQFDCPVLLLTEHSVTKCPVLRDLGFQRVKDPYTAYQEISMYIGGVMAQKVNPTVVLSDKSKILKRGFDPVYGFRRRKEDKK